MASNARAILTAADTALKAWEAGEFRQVTAAEAFHTHGYDIGTDTAGFYRWPDGEAITTPHGLIEINIPNGNTELAFWLDPITGSIERV